MGAVHSGSSRALTYPYKGLHVEPLRGRKKEVQQGLREPVVPWYTRCSPTRGAPRTISRWRANTTPRSSLARRIATAVEVESIVPKPRGNGGPAQEASERVATGQAVATIGGGPGSFGTTAQRRGGGKNRRRLGKRKEQETGWKPTAWEGSDGEGDGVRGSDDPGGRGADDSLRGLREQD